MIGCGGLQMMLGHDVVAYTAEDARLKWPRVQEQV